MTCSATLRASDHRIADVSKLPETASLPSGEIATARTGPPCPRICARAAPMPSGNSRRAAHRLLSNNDMTGFATRATRRNLAIRRLHAEGANAHTRGLVAQRRKECLHGGTVAAALHHEEIVMFRRHRNEAEAVHF